MKKTVKLAKSLLSVANELDSMGLTKEADVLDKVASSLVKRAADTWVPQEDVGAVTSWVGKDPGSSDLSWAAHAAGSFARSLAKGRVPYQLKAMVDALSGRPGYGAALQTVSDQVDTLKNNAWKMSWDELKKATSRVTTPLKVIIRELDKEGGQEHGPEYAAAQGMLNEINAAMAAAEEDAKKGLSSKKLVDDKGNGIEMSVYGPGGVANKLRDSSQLESAQETAKKL